MDRRVYKSKKAIMDALIQLMSEKDFETITINEIADEANVNRGTIYLHYTDKYDLLNQCIEDHLSKLFKSCLPNGDVSNFPSEAGLLRIFEYLEQHFSFYSVMLTNKGVPTFRNRLLTMVQRGLAIKMEKMNESNANGDINRDVTVQFLASAIIGTIEWWLVQSMPYPAKNVVKELYMLIDRVWQF